MKPLTESAFRGVHRRMCERKKKVDYTTWLDAGSMNAHRSSEAYLCPFCGWVHFTKTGVSHRNARRDRKKVELTLAMAASAGK